MVIFVGLLSALMCCSKDQRNPHICLYSSLSIKKAIFHSASVCPSSRMTVKRGIHLYLTNTFTRTTAKCGSHLSSGCSKYRRWSPGALKRLMQGFHVLYSGKCTSLRIIIMSTCSHDSWILLFLLLTISWLWSQGFLRPTQGVCPGVMGEE